MVRKKKKREEETVTFCYYCDRIFADETTLIQHQKARHYKCSTCHKKLNTIQGLAIHCSQVHKVSVDSVPNALPGKDSVNIEIFGMAGVPEGAVPGGGPVAVDEPDSKRPAVGAPQPIPQAPAYSQPSAAYAPQPYAYPPAGLAPRGLLPPGYPYSHPPGAPPGFQQPPPMMMPPVRPPGMPVQLQPPPGSLPLQGPPGSMPPPTGQPVYSMPPPAQTQGGVPGPAQPLFPIGGAPPGGVQPQQQPAQSSALPGGSLFPIAQQPAAGAGLQPGVPQAGGRPTGSVAEQAAEETKQVSSDAGLVWQEENISMEERRAMLPKYAPKRMQQVHGDGQPQAQPGPDFHAQQHQVASGAYH